MLGHNAATNDGRPCSYMRILISTLADGSVGGLLRWYARYHASGCPRCSSALVSLVMLRSRLAELAPPPSSPPEDAPLEPARRIAVEEAWGRIEEEHA